MQSKYQGRFGRGRRSSDLSEDVNPSAYIVNLADCMLVLACGFMVAMIAFWGIDLNSSLTDEDMEKVEADVVPEDLSGSGSNYVEAGKVYVDTATGEYYILKQDAEEIAAEEEQVESNAAEEQASADNAEATQEGTGTNGAPEGDETG